MRKLVSAVMVVVLSFGCLILTPQCVQAKTSSKTQIKKLVKQMDDYEYKILSSGSTKVKLTKTEMAKAAALSLKLTEKDHIKVAEFGEDDIYKISNKKLKAAGKRIFGISLSSKNLPDGKTRASVCDAYRQKDGTAVVSVANVETECDYVVHSTKITKKSANTYQVKKNLYYGYWGYNNGQSNYTVVYQVKKSSKSSYGFKITKMQIITIE